jgi:hypothetical protein
MEVTLYYSNDGLRISIPGSNVLITDSDDIDLALDEINVCIETVKDLASGFPVTLRIDLGLYESIKEYILRRQ